MFRGFSRNWCRSYFICVVGGNRCFNFLFCHIHDACPPYPLSLPSIPTRVFDPSINRLRDTIARFEVRQRPNTNNRTPTSQRKLMIQTFPQAPQYTLCHDSILYTNPVPEPHRLRFFGPSAANEINSHFSSLLQLPCRVFAQPMTPA